MSPLSSASCPLVNAPAFAVAMHTVCGQRATSFMRQAERRGSHSIVRNSRRANPDQAGSKLTGTPTTWSPKTYRHLSDQGNLIATV